MSLYFFIFTTFLAIIPIWLSIFFQEFPFIIIGIPIYAITFYLDIKSTTSFGLKKVQMWETSILFARLSKYGFQRAIIIQLISEITLAVLLSILFTHELNIPVTGGFLITFGIIHFMGYYSNGKLKNSPAQ